ncbi:hypothetical protein [Massilia rhizosphaerae]|uniref:hypothetical protein n=1 Tax=Massilia rhizosphaerae TaxID=2784389 RepID=UPI0018DE8B01|nr:hypothetical protein [Massilia rhizosphaerae]
MSQTASLHRASMSQRQDAGRAMLGWGISVLCHVLAVAWLWHAWLSHRPATDAAPVRRIEVRLVPLVPDVPAPAPAPTVTVPRPSPFPTRAARRPMPPRRQAPAPAAPAAPTATAHELPADAAPAGTGAAAPTVDLAAARATARLIAREEGKGLVALPDRKPVVDPNADHHVVDRFERARRVDCQTARAQSTNLLANVVLLAVDMAKNAIDDSGCKW